MFLSELKFKTEIKVSEEYYSTCKEANYNKNDFSQIIKNLNEPDPLNKLKGLVGLRKLYLIEKEKKEPVQIFEEIDVLYNILENFPEEFKYESLVCLICIESINLVLNKSIKNEPTQKIIQILFYILSFPKQVKYEMLKADLEYVNLIIQNKEFVKKIGVENICQVYEDIKKIIEKDFPNDTNIIKKCLELFCNFFENKELSQKFDKFSELISLLEGLITKFESNKDVLITSLQLLSILSNVNKQPEQYTIKVMNEIIILNMLPKLIQYTELDNIEDNNNKIYYSLRILGNFASMENGFYTDQIIKVNVLDVKDVYKLVGKMQ